MLALAEDAWLAVDSPRDERRSKVIADQTVPASAAIIGCEHNSGSADPPRLQLLLAAAAAPFPVSFGGLAGYGMGALMLLVLVPLIGAEPVVPIIAISAVFSNISRTAAFCAMSMCAVR